MFWIEKPKSIFDHGMPVDERYERWFVAAFISVDVKFATEIAASMRDHLTQTFGPARALLVDGRDFLSRNIFLLVAPDDDILAWVEIQAQFKPMQKAVTQWRPVDERWQELSAFYRLELIQRAGLAPDDVRQAVCPPAVSLLLQATP